MQARLRAIHERVATVEALMQAESNGAAHGDSNGDGCAGWRHTLAVEVRHLLDVQPSILVLLEGGTITDLGVIAQASAPRRSHHSPFPRPPTVPIHRPQGSQDHSPFPLASPRRTRLRNDA